MSEVRFADRHIGPRKNDVKQMLSILGYQSIDEFTKAVVPEVIRWNEALNLPAALSEEEVSALAKTTANKNSVNTSVIGMGYYNAYTPAVIKRNILENPAWYTAYTPYQPEISQGRLEALINFQTMIEDLTGLPVAGASLLDEPTAVAEAMTLALRQGKTSANAILVDEDIHPQTLAVLMTRAKPLGVDVQTWNTQNSIPAGDFAGVVISYPGSSGNISNIGPIIDAIKSSGAMAIVTTDLLALTLLESPGSLGADIVVGSAQRFGVPMGFGGPHAGFMSVRSGLERSLPGRLVGVSIDADGAPAYRLALQTREQHIRREKATSNICTAQVLLAIISGMYAAYHGPQGLTEIAKRINGLTSILAAHLNQHGYLLGSNRFFDTITITAPNARQQADQLEKIGINVRRTSQSALGISLDETSTFTTIQTIAQVLTPGEPISTEMQSTQSIPSTSVRTTSFLQHPVFNTYRSETAMLRYLRKLSDKDIALDRSMIPLGSCTMN
jgi:glycine dehydrogenase